MRWSRPRFTIMSLMIAVVIASLVLTGIVVRRERNRRLVALQAASANYWNAKLTREVTEIAVVEYEEGIYKQDLSTVEGEIALAESDLKRARELSKFDQQTIDMAKLKLERSQLRKLELENDIQIRTVKALKNEVTAAKTDELAKKAAYEQLKAIVASQWW
jgi:HlyD family secretion protein